MDEGFTLHLAGLALSETLCLSVLVKIGRAHV